jgi:acyl carrier protein
MQISDSILQDVRRLVAEILELELSEVGPEDLFFEDLGGESIELIELSFHLDKLYGVRLRFQDLVSEDFTLDDRGCLTPDSLATLRHKFPFLKLDGFETRPLARRSAFLTIEAIAGFLQMAVESKPSEIASARES